MKNIPEKIYLNIGCADITTDNTVDDFNELTEITWCADKINDDDIEYSRLSASVISRLKEEIISTIYYDLIMNFTNIGRNNIEMSCEDFRELPEIKKISTIMEYLESKYDFLPKITKSD